MFQRASESLPEAMLRDGWISLGWMRHWKLTMRLLLRMFILGASLLLLLATADITILLELLLFVSRSL